MTDILPDSQTVKRKVAVHINETLAAHAESNKQELHEWIEYPKRVVRFEPDSKEWFGYRSVHHMSIEELTHVQQGKGDEFILDFDSHRVGCLSFYLGAIGDNIDAPCRLRLTFGEVPTDVTSDLSDCNTWISTSWLPEEVINVDWLPCQVSLPRRYSFRYVRVQVVNTSQKYKCLFSGIQVKATSAVSPKIYDAVPPLQSDDPLLQQVDEVSRVTLRDCMHTVFEDGPRRDRRLWLGDLRIQALVNYATFKNFDLVKRCLYMFAAVAAEDGSLPACVFEYPTLKAASDYIVDYDALFGVILYEYITASDDLETAKMLWPTVLGSLKTPISHINPTSGAFDCTTTNLWKFLDWDESIHHDAGMHGLLLFNLKSVKRLANRLNVPFPYDNIIENVTTAAKSVFYRKDLNCFVSGPNHQISWLSQAWMALAEVLTPEENKSILVSTMQNPHAVRPLCPYGWAVFAEALAKNKAKEECVVLLKEYWGGMVTRGADTFWECFDPQDARKSPYGDCRNNSYCHAWSCSPAWVMRELLDM